MDHTTIFFRTSHNGVLISISLSFAHLGAGLTVGMSSLAAGLAIGIVGDAGVRANAQQVGAIF